MPPLADHTGKRFGRLTVLQRALDRPRVQWLCVCDCGVESIVEACSLVSGHTRSCGCLHLETAKREVVKRSLVHGHNRRGRRSLTYNTWVSMHKRCYDPKEKSFEAYGGRGITIDPRWHTFDNFLKDMGERPADRTIDRINTYGNYEPGNCRWATRIEQRHNRRKESRR